MPAVQPLRLAANPVQHFYRGGARIAALRGFTATTDHQPEEWVAATVARFGEETTGLAVTHDGVLLRDLVEADPASWLGTEAATSPARSGPADTGLLVKLLDAGQRLPVHAHPDRAFAASHLGCPYGKTESWFVIDAEPDAAVHLGWTEEVDAAELAVRRDEQDSDWMLSRMHRVPVRPGDAILVPAGQVHAIGEGVFVVEAQEPTDFSILLEWWVTTSGREESHLGLGFDQAMAAVSHEALPADDLAALRRHVDPGLTGRRLLRALPSVADHFFRVDVVAPGAELSEPVPAGFAAVIALEGGGALVSGQGEVDVAGGDLLAVPAAFGDWSVRGPLRLVVARPGRDWPANLSVGPAGSR
ncbi:MAG TPA: mannose-6-phosphate isomerase [Marmoricola sp.]|nr:mannose-6-phosphate isomerase [Marmoricola sp.]